ncbi:hypothetical protein J437_LFUL016165 [Ladona fulva]|uniref:Carboxylesterase type B domain-containing protein n=1 Tax=Ladona fulva TaxID=123851 RepID=A0A8K0KJ13_LADFU|nr:hypothetical protein J437_LFUL016165 [Ladona fulva]
MYLFPQEGITLNAGEKKISQTLTQIWADFVIHGNPAPAMRHINIPAWEPYKKEDDRYLVIANDGIKVAQGFRQQLTITHDNGLEFGHSGGHISSQISLTVLSITAFFMLFR